MHLKKRSLFLLTFLLLLIYSCYDDLSLPSHGDRDSGEFSISEAHKYFEENATDLSFIHITDSAHIHSRSVSRKAELSPDWERAVRTVGKEATLIEVPLNSNTVLLESVRYFTKGKITLSKGGVSRIRLVMAQRTDGSVDMFVATLVPSPRYPNTQDDLDSFRYLGGQGNFTGKVFCSTLDGHFVEAHQYIDGKYFSKVQAIPRAHLDKLGVDLSDVSYESITFSSGSLSRSGTYDFDEIGGSGFSMCYYHPNYLAENCPFCFGVVVIACRTCGIPLEDGEICSNCFCYWCMSSPCVCCDWCYNYPCKCSNNDFNCPVCSPFPCEKCTYCDSHYCYGQCQNTGSGGGGGSTTPSNPTPAPNPAPGDTIKHEQYIILLSDSLARKDLKQFVWRKQLDGTNSCVQASIENVAKMINANNYPRMESIIERYEQIADSIYGEKEQILLRGTPNSIVHIGMKDYFKDRIVNDTTNISIDYKKAIDNNNVVITNVPLSSKEWHSIIVIGYTKDNCFIYIDPNIRVFHFKCSESFLKINRAGKYSFEINIKSN